MAMDTAVLFDFTPAEPEGVDTLPQLTHEVLQLYQELLLHPTSKTRSLQDSQNLVDHFGRLRIWIEQTGAALENQGSLSESLRDEPSLRSSVTDVLRQLKLLLSAAKSIPVSSSRPTLLAAEPNNEVESSLTSDSEYSAESQQGGQEADKPRPRISRFSLVLSHIFEQIGLLYHYSAIFRRPRLQGRYLHSKSDSSDPAIPHYEYSHVQQRFREWASNVSAAGGELDETKQSPAPQNPSPEFSFEVGVLCMRFAAANTRRREQLRYWARHPFTEGHDLGMEPSLPKEAAAPAISEGTSRRSHTTTVKTFSSIARSDIFETEMQVGQSRTVYSDTTMSDIGSPSSVRVPAVPLIASSEPTFECPFCRMTLDSAAMRDRNTWKRHVFRDLRPYTCTFPQCGNPDKLYATRREWVYHEMQMHRRHWKCRPCSSSFETKELMASHLRSSHPEWEERQFPAVLEVSEAPLDGSQHQTCPLCQLPFTLSVLLKHMAGHMEQLALFVLPSGEHGPPEEPSSAALSSLDTFDEEEERIAEDKVDWLREQEAAGGARSPPSQLYVDYDVNGVEIDDLSAPSPRGSPPSETVVFTCDQCNRVFDQIHKFK